VAGVFVGPLGVGEASGDRDESAFGEVGVVLFGGGAEAFDWDEVGAFDAADVCLT